MTHTLKSFGYRIALLLGFAAACLSAGAGAQAPVQDVDYKLINPPVPPAGKKIEVIEFFSYACPHCAVFEEPLRKWLKKKPADVEFKAMPMIFRESWAPLARLYFTLESMNLADKLHGKVFSAIHTENKNLEERDSIIGWVEKQGVNRKSFTDVYNSFGMDSKVEQAKKVGRQHNVPFTPALSINGKYLTGVSMTKGPDGNPSMTRFFEVVDALIAMERAKTEPVKKSEGKPAAANKKKVEQKS